MQTWVEPGSGALRSLGIAGAGPAVGEPKPGGPESRKPAQRGAGAHFERPGGISSREPRPCLRGAAGPPGRCSSRSLPEACARAGVNGANDANSSPAPPPLPGPVRTLTPGQIHQQDLGLKMAQEGRIGVSQSLELLLVPGCPKGSELPVSGQHLSGCIHHAEGGC